VITTPGGGVVSSGGGAANSYRPSLGASWSPDVWGRIRRTVEGARGSAQASEADLAAATLSAQAELATNYFDLRSNDAEIALLTQVIAGYQRSLEITRNRYNAGIAPHSDLLQAQSQLATTQADLSDLTRSRAVFEHAIAVLVGETPETFSLAANPSWSAASPQIPAGVPSTLLQRRPDIAAAERRAAAASAQIGVETSAYFPDLTLTGSYGFAASELGNLFSASTNVWSFGASAAQTLFDAGATRARVAGARAAYDQSVANYRQTVLAAFQDVEDQLAGQRTLADQYELRRQAAVAGDRAAVMVLNQYRAGQVAYTDVVTAQATALTAQRTLVQAAAARQTTAVALIEALGGGWTAAF
jgi:NodT family efflux transporter outer membrane factor (OMF) lipoprotein